VRPDKDIFKPLKFSDAMLVRLSHFAFAVLMLCVGQAHGQQYMPNVEIVRDMWGVPHIFGKSDADVAYGLAWATAEDDFETVQQLLLAAHGRLGEVTGKNGALLDFMGKITDIEARVECPI
jgi:acyl-homoserine-lactone acylase